MLNSIPFSLLELAPMIKGDSVTNTLHKSTKYAQRADELGFNRF
ncbi:MAG TPA: LLM class flavin-dependent oxidoreductase, partial [Pseudoalteromonas sp.]|nr:LLM class flavin-dependent oxidoreductase [Pseudoalteromonas sp.]